MEPCERCGEGGRKNICPMDGRYHHHGCVHTPGGGLEWLCRDCAAEVEMDVIVLRRHREEIRSLPEAACAHEWEADERWGEDYCRRCGMTRDRLTT